MSNRTRKEREIKLPECVAHLPDKPANGNYIIQSAEPGGWGNWVHAESLAEAYAEFRRGHGHCPFTSKRLDGVVVCDATDDFVIYHIDGSIRATKIDKVYGTGCYADQEVQK